MPLFVPCAGNVSLTEYSALRSFYSSTNGPSWQIRAGFRWSFLTTDLYAPCTQHWAGIACGLVEPTSAESKCYIAYLDLSRSNLQGSLPQDFGSLNKLAYVDFQQNALTGTLPSSLGALTNLVYFFTHLNSLTGTIPNVFANMPYLQYLYLYSNRLTGPLPTYLPNMLSLHIFYAQRNRLTGTIPSNFGLVQYLFVIGINENLLTGTLPPQLGSLPYMQGLGLYVNYFTGTLPSEYGLLSNAFGIGVYTNHLTGIIPASYAALSKLQYFALDHNDFTGTIPTFLGSLAIMTSLGLGYNSFVGTIPTELGRLPLVEQFWLQNNALHGTIPSELGNLKNVSQLLISCNSLSGTVPETLGQLSHLQQLSVAFNRLHGSLPAGLKHLPITVFNVSHNALTGRLTDLIPMDQPWLSMSYFDASYNRFSGSVPPALFLSSNLIAVSLNSNCFGGLLHTHLCHAVRLETLILDGLVTGSSCLMEVPGSLQTFVRGTFSTSKLAGEIPACVWSMPNLQTLHISDNGLSGTIGEAPESSKLTDLNVENNHLSGSIPLSLQRNGRFRQLVLAGNRLSGTLAPDFNITNTQFLKLRVNRLSGDVPASLVDAPANMEIDVLSGNLFQCSNGAVPENDPVASQYGCGSNNLDYSLSAWIGFAGLLSVLISVGNYFAVSDGTDSFPPETNICRRLLTIPCTAITYCIIFWKDFTHISPKDAFKNCNNFFRTLKKAIRIAVCISSLYCVVGIPLFVCLKRIKAAEELYSTHEREYTWVSTAAYLHGAIPIIIVLVLLLSSQQILRIMFFHDDAPVPEKRFLIKRTFRENAVRHTIRAGIHLLNIAATLTVNFAYVTAIFNGLTEYQLFAIQAGLSVYKLVWDKIVVPTMIRNMRNSSEKYSACHQVFMTIFNYIFGPIIAVYSTDSNCMLYAFIGHPTITSSFLETQPGDPICAPSQTSAKVVCGVQLVTTTLFTTITPTWRYSYQCGSALLVDYVPVLVLTYTVSGIIAPALRYAIALLPADIVRRFIPQFIDEWFLKDSILYPSTDPDDATAKTPEPQPSSSIVPMSRHTQLTKNMQNIQDLSTLSRSHLFDGATVIRRTLLDFAVLLTFGLASPLLGITVAVSLLNSAVLWRSLIAKYIEQANAMHVNAITRIEGATAGATAGLLESTYIVVLIVAIFWSLLLFDMAADVYGNAMGSILVITVIVINPMLYIFSTIKKNRVANKVFAMRKSSVSDASPGADRRASKARPLKGDAEEEMDSGAAVVHITNGWVGEDAESLTDGQQGTGTISAIAASHPEANNSNPVETVDEVVPYKADETRVESLA